MQICFKFRAKICYFFVTSKQMIHFVKFMMHKIESVLKKKRNFAPDLLMNTVF